MKAKFYRQIFEKYSNVKFHEHSFIGSRVFPCWPKNERTDTTNLIVTYRNFAKKPTNFYQGWYYGQQCVLLQSYIIKF